MITKLNSVIVYTRALANHHFFTPMILKIGQGHWLHNFAKTFRRCIYGIWRSYLNFEIIVDTRILAGFHPDFLELISVDLQLS